MAMTVRTRSTAEQRRDEVLEAATRAFAARGFAGTPTLDIANAAGISHPYLFRLFPTKTDLAVAVVQRCNRRIHQVFSAAAARAHARGEDVLAAMGAAYLTLIQDGETPLVQLHAHAASVSEPRIREAMRAGLADLYALVSTETQRGDAEIRAFFGYGMMLNALCALDATTLDADWARTMRSA
jgi:AcrR family transcriptional regulator